MISLLCPAYLPNIRYFVWILEQKKIYISGETSYQKQTFRNRAEIYGANGKLKLIIPIRHIHNRSKQLDKNVKIAYDKDWQHHHWKSICIAYQSSPYFEFYKSDLLPFYKKKTISLFDYNFNLLKQIISLIDLPFNFELVKWNSFDYNRMDQLISTKKELDIQFEIYTQVFDSKFGFINNLSILDLLFNQGPNSRKYLYEMIEKNI